MRMLIVLVVICLAAVTSAALAAEPPDGDPDLARLRAIGTVRGPVAAAAAREAARLSLSPGPARNAAVRRQPQVQRKRSWVGRHPAIFGALVGFGGGFLVGYLPGDDAVFDDFTAGFNGWVMGGVGAGVGAATGAIVGRLRK